MAGVLLALAVVLMTAMHALAERVAAGAPGWLNLVVLVLAWDGIKVALLAARSGLGALALAAAACGQSRSGAGALVALRCERRTFVFGDEPTPEAPIAPAVTPIAEWQIDLLRKALDARGLTTMSERQSAIEAAAGRPVESLRALTHDEGLQVLSRLGQAPASGRGETRALKSPANRLDSAA